MAFAEQLRKIRARRSISQSELAKRIGVSRSAICNYENGNRENPSFPIIVALANALDVPINELIGDEAASEAMFSLVNGNMPKEIKEPEPPSLREQLEAYIGNLNDKGLHVMLSVAENLSDDCQLKWITEDDNIG